MGPGKSGLIRQVTFKKFSIHMKFAMTEQENCDLLNFNTGDCLIEVTVWAGLTVHIYLNVSGCYL